MSNEVNYPELTHAISKHLATLRADVPEVMQGFNDMARAATRDGALDKKTKELIALALGVAARCDGCLASTPRHWSSWAPARRKWKKRWRWRSTWAAARR